MSINIKEVFEHSSYENIIYTYLVYFSLPIGLTAVILTRSQYDNLEIKNKKTTNEYLKVTGNAYNLILQKPNKIIAVNEIGEHKKLNFISQILMEKKVLYTTYTYNNIELKIVLNFSDELLDKIVIGNVYEFHLSNYTLAIL